MKWFRFLSRTKKRPAAAPAPEPSQRQAFGIDYLFAQAGVAAPVTDPPVTEPPAGAAPVAAPIVTVPATPVPQSEPAAGSERLITVAIEWEPLHAKAEEANQRGDWVRAEVLWRVMRTGFPHIWSSYVGGAVALFNLGRREEAAHLLADAALRFPEERAIPLEQGRQAMQRADWTAAETHWRTALTFDLRPWWVYTELAGALENQDRLLDAEAVLLDARVNAEDPNEITLYTYPARLAWKREEWALALTRWVEARQRFPLAEELPAREYEAKMRLAELDPEGYEAAVRDLALTSPDPASQGLAAVDEDMRAMMLRFESLGGTGPDGGCEFGCVQRQHGAEPLGLFRWAAVSPTGLIAGLTTRFAGIGEMDAITIDPHEAQWEITDKLYGSKMHSFVSSEEVPRDRMMALASKRMRYLKDKLLADLENPEKIFVLKVAWRPIYPEEIEELDRLIRSYGPGQLFCVCQSDRDHPAGEIVSVAPAVFVGYLDFAAQPDVVLRRPAWVPLCRAILPKATASRNLPGFAETPLTGTQ